MDTQPTIQRAPRRTRPLQERFWRKVYKTETCWLWTASCDYGGYGAFRSKSRSLRAHRYSYVLHYGAFDPALLVLHECDTPACVRPDHLFLGTHLDNMQDAARKGRLPGRPPKIHHAYPDALIAELDK